MTSLNCRTFCTIRETSRFTPSSEEVVMSRNVMLCDVHNYMHFKIYRFQWKVFYTKKKTPPWINKGPVPCSTNRKNFANKWKKKNGHVFGYLWGVTGFLRNWNDWSDCNTFTKELGIFEKFKKRCFNNAAGMGTGPLYLELEITFLFNRFRGELIISWVRQVNGRGSWIVRQYPSFNLAEIPLTTSTPILTTFQFYDQKLIYKFIYSRLYHKTIKKNTGEIQTNNSFLQTSVGAQFIFINL